MTDYVERKNPWLRDGEMLLAEYCSRYYCKAILGHIQRGLAIREWQKMLLGNSRDYDSLERALSAFDMFVLEDKEGDFEEVNEKSPTYHTSH